jgi:hypothetical protein
MSTILLIYNSSLQFHGGGEFTCGLGPFSLEQGELPYLLNTGAVLHVLTDLGLEELLNIGFGDEVFSAGESNVVILCPGFQWCKDVMAIAPYIHVQR